MVNIHERMARESEAMRRITPERMPSDEIDFGATLGEGVEAKYTETLIDPQWIGAWKLYLDREGGEYGVPVLLPRGQWDQGGPNALINARRPDGGFAFTLVEPPRLAPEPRIECFVGVCPKRLNTRIELVEHVRAFHGDEAVNYNSVLEQIMRQAVNDDPRLQAVVKSLDTLERTPMGEAPAYMAQISELGAEVFPCAAEGCRRFFDSDSGRALHMRKEHR